MKTMSGDFLPIIKWNAQSGRMSRIDRGEEPRDIPFGTTFAFDFGTLEAGYVFFGMQGPERVMVPYSEGVTLPAQPQERDEKGALIKKPGFYVKVIGNAFDGAREWCSNAASLLNAIDGLYQRYKVAPEAAAGKIPVIIITGVTAIHTGTGQRKTTNYAPNFEIKQWVDRPAELGPRTTPLPGWQPAVQAPPPVQAAPPPPPVQTALPPVQQPAQQPPPRPTMPF
jgi:hypothetical protein